MSLDRISGHQVVRWSIILKNFSDITRRESYLEGTTLPTYLPTTDSMHASFLLTGILEILSLFMTRISRHRKDLIKNFRVRLLGKPAFLDGNGASFADEKHNFSLCITPDFCDTRRENSLFGDCGVLLKFHSRFFQVYRRRPRISNEQKQRQGNLCALSFDHSLCFCFARTTRSIFPLRLRSSTAVLEVLYLLLGKNRVIDMAKDGVDSSILICFLTGSAAVGFSLGPENFYLVALG
jgi:hypothetical protein